MFKLPNWRYGWRDFCGDLSGGLIAALIALPYGLALATLMGLPPVLGLFTSLLTAPITAVLGRNPVLVGGTASATVPFLALAVRSQGIGAAKVSIVAAVFMMAFCVLRLGRYITRVPPAVVSGFSCGIGAMMIVAQLPTMMGLPAGQSSTVAGQLFGVIERLDEMRLAPLLLGTTVAGVALTSARWAPRVPAPLAGVVAATLVAKVFGLVEKEVGKLPLEIPPLAGFSWTPADVVTVLPSGLALAVVASVNVLITSRVVEHFRGRHRPLRASDADAELGAYGIANVCAGMFGAPLSVGIPARSLANVRCGGTSRLSNVLHALWLLLFLRLGASFVEHTSLPALAGVTAYIGLCLLDWGTWRRLPKMRRIDAAAFLVTAIAVVGSNAVLAVAAGCGVYGARWLWLRVRPAIPMQPTTAARA